MERAAILEAQGEVAGIVEAARGKILVLLDSGIRRGADVLKALALGARAVLLGRPYVYALASHGEEGVRHIIRTMMAEIDLQLALSGLTSIGSVDRSLLVSTAVSSTPLPRPR